MEIAHHCIVRLKKRLRGNNNKGRLSLTIKFVNPRNSILHHKTLVHLANQIDFQVKNAFFEDKLNPDGSSYGSPGK